MKLILFWFVLNPGHYISEYDRRKAIEDALGECSCGGHYSFSDPVCHECGAELTNSSLIDIPGIFIGNSSDYPGSISGI